MKTFAKSILRFLSLVTVLPAVVAFRLQTGLVGRDKAFPGWSQLFSLIPGLVGVYLRNAFYSCCLTRCGRDACVSFGTILSHPDTQIGQTAYLGNYCSIGNARIGSDVLIASHVSVMNGCHQHGIERLDIPVREQTGHYPVVTIGDDSWIGERAVVAADIGRHCVIGAGALVISPIPDYAVAVGVPARIIGDRRELSRRPDQAQRRSGTSHV